MTTPADQAPYQDPSRTVEERVEDLLDRMTLAEKVGQMLQLDARAGVVELIQDKHVGSILHASPERVLEAIALQAQTRLGIPLLTADDCIHGHSFWPGATIFGSQLSMACSWDTGLIERAARGVELGVSVVDLGDGPRALPPVEIRTDDGPYDYDARYNPGRSEYFVPARLDPALIRVAEEAAVLAHRALGLRHISRTDLILGTDGVPWFLEVNTAPGMTETSLLPLAAGATGQPLGELYRQVVETAVRDAQR